MHGGKGRQAQRKAQNGGLKPRIEWFCCWQALCKSVGRFRPPKQVQLKNGTVTERTLSIIKPDATRRNLCGQVTARLEAAGLRIVALKRLQLTIVQAKQFYAVHAERPFFEELCEFMASGPIVVQVLEAENAIALNRQVMGATNPADAAEGTIRRDLAVSLTENSVHGSDAPRTAAEEVAFFFSETEIVG